MAISVNKHRINEMGLIIFSDYSLKFKCQVSSSTFPILALNSCCHSLTYDMNWLESLENNNFATCALNSSFGLCA